MSLLLPLNRYHRSGVFIVDFEQVKTGWIIFFIVLWSFSGHVFNLTLK